MSEDTRKRDMTLMLRMSMTFYLAVLLSVCGLVISGAISVGAVGLLVVGIVWFYILAMVKPWR